MTDDASDFALPPNPALFVDFDGTLVPIAPRPQDVQVPPWVVPTLAALREQLAGAVAVVSGRPIDQLDAFLAPLVLPAAGVHGVQRRGAGGRMEQLSAIPPPGVLSAATALAERHPGLLLEPKPSGFALHYRARPELAFACRDALQQALDAAEPGWQLMAGHAVFELKQSAVSKATAVLAFLAEAPFAGRTPVYIGDDVTDEDGIRAAQGEGGIGVRVGNGVTEARYRLTDPEDVGRWLQAALQAAGPAADARS